MRVTAQVDPHLEISEIVDRVVRAGGPALLFENVKGSKLPLAINVFGTQRADGDGARRRRPRRDRRADRRPAQARAAAGLRRHPRTRWASCGQLRDVPPKKVRKARLPGGRAARATTSTSDLLPGLHTWPDDGGVFLNLGLTHTKHPETGQAQPRPLPAAAARPRTRSACTGRSTRTRPPTTRSPSGAASGCRSRSRSAATRWSPTPRRAPLPGDIDEYLFAGFLRRRAGRDGRLPDRAAAGAGDAQVVLEGWLEPGERLPEGPFGDHTGFYTPVEPFPALHVECMTIAARSRSSSRSSSVEPPQEDGPLGKATERIFLPLLKLLIPDIVDYDLPVDGRLPQLRDRQHRQALSRSTRRR